MYLFAGFSEDIFEMLAGSISKKEVQSKLEKDKLIRRATCG